MARKKLNFVKNGEEEENLDKADDEEEGTPLKKKVKLSVSADPEPVRSEPAESGSACSSPSASGFIVMPIVKSKPKNSKVFSDEDEIGLLKGLAVFWANGKNNKWAEFHDFIKNDLTKQFNRSQVYEKVRKLKKKFETNFEKARLNGGHPDFSDTHEMDLFRLSKALWGDEKDALEEANVMIERNRELEDVFDDDDEGVTQKMKNGKEQQVKEIANMIDRKGELKDDEKGVNKKKKKKKNGKEQVDEHGQEQVKEIANMIERKEELKDVVDDDDEEGVNKKRKKKNGKEQVDEHVQEQVKEIANMIERKEELKDVVDDEEEGVNKKKKKKKNGKEQVKEISEEEDFQCSFPLLYASFDSFKYGNIVKQRCNLIPRDEARELEDRCRKLEQEAIRLELKKMELIKRDLLKQLQKN